MTYLRNDAFNLPDIPHKKRNKKIGLYIVESRELENGYSFKIKYAKEITPQIEYDFFEYLYLFVEKYYCYFAKEKVSGNTIEVEIKHRRKFFKFNKFKKFTRIIENYDYVANL